MCALATLCPLLLLLLLPLTVIADCYWQPGWICPAAAQNHSQPLQTSWKGRNRPYDRHGGSSTIGVISETLELKPCHR